MEILIDLDILLYRFSSSAEYAAEWTDGMYTLQADKNQAVDNTMNFIDTHIVSEIAQQMHLGSTPHYRAFITHPDNFRVNLLPSYKGNRSVTRKPILLQPMREWALDALSAEMVDTLEADDLLGLAGYKREDAVICSIDKDLLVVPGQHFNFDRPEEGIIKQDARSAALRFYAQVLTGDSVDNFKGCPGVGPKTATKVLDGAETAAEMWERVVEQYEKKDLDEEEAIVQARCAHILHRPSDYNFETGELTLWEPPR